MSSRPRVQVVVRIPADGGSTPNAYKPYVSAEIRVCWPPKATSDQIVLAVSEAVAQALGQVGRRRDRPSRDRLTGTR